MVRREGFNPRDDPVIELPEAAEVLGITLDSRGYNLFAVIPRSAFLEADEHEMKTVAPLIPCAAGTHDLPEDTEIIPFTNGN